MKKNILLILLAKIFFFSAILGQVEDSIFNPEPRVKLDTSKTSNSRKEKKNEYEESFVLDGYGSGEFIHPSSNTFLQTLAIRIKYFKDLNYKINSINVIGFADGEPNDGIKVDLKTISSECNNPNFETIDDKELATLRGCILRYDLYRKIKQAVVGELDWFSDSYDEPDGGKKGGKHRKVIVQIKFSKNE